MAQASIKFHPGGSGAGLTGLLGCTIFFGLSTLLFITENYFASLLFVSFALLFYVTGRDITKVILSSFTIFFSNKHLIPNANYLEETVNALTDTLQFTRDSKGEIKVGPLNQGQKITLPNNPLVNDIQKLLSEGKGVDYVEYVAHSYYIECHELYDFTSANLDFAAVSMPIFGLIGTIIGLISMFDNLGSVITIEALSPQLAMALKTTLYGAFFSAVYKIMGSRFERRIRTLDYDYETFFRAIEVLLENKVEIEIGK
ncbi:MAG: MotA/TolQ/ExbB proton channel family protein [Oligoflexia bacterium]|nr:MotA/TolQ/ExbB proton channel family protein [Oligoflexia bacterium]